LNGWGDQTKHSNLITVDKNRFKSNLDKVLIKGLSIIYR
jgi:hypothetical protein